MPRHRPSCRLQFGIFYNKERTPAQLRASDYLTVWLGTRSKQYGVSFNPFHHGRMLHAARAHNATAVYYAYLIAMLARHREGIQDCDIGAKKNLCELGANFIRSHEQIILETYESYADNTARILGRDAPVVWLMEPDWHQYSEPTQRGGALSQEGMASLFASMVARIKRHLPAALISFDVSPWVSDYGNWMAPFLPMVDHVHTSGGRTTGASDRIRGQASANLLTWAELHRVSKRGIIADTGYGVAGRLTAESTLDAAWLDAGSLRDRISDGVIGVTFANPVAGWEQRVDRLRTTLPPARHCLGLASTSMIMAHPRRHGLGSLQHHNSSKRSSGHRASRTRGPSLTSPVLPGLRSTDVSAV